MTENKSLSAVVWVIEDHPLYRDALALLLQAQLSVTAFTFDGVAAALASQQPAPDLMLVDFNLQGNETGTRALNALRARFPSVTLVSHSAVEDPICVQAALQAGAQAFISKAISPEGLVTQLQQLIAATPVLPYWINADGPQPLSRAEPFVFTERQHDIIKMMLRGKSNKEIALELALAEITVKQHLSKIFEKLGVNTRTQAIAKLNTTFHEIPKAQN
ncbi:response regulator transcription factor [Parvibium lacunae]|uniref:DNA-binding response regulator n=1 Tax=Parvibium lacunae TaxID=1888893 RepID=A0A368L0H4_9BURK|nr:response regulator transcription factor [Parvibium lacunae]RCS57049.1 DNA-binding response regulator [Parvibium lacunae]